MWREIFEEFPSAEPRGPVDSDDVGRVEVGLGQALPADLRDFLLKSNGLTDEYGADVVWSAERILRDNLAFRGDAEYRSLYSSFDSLLFFGDDGGGDQFAFVRQPERNEVFVWDHEMDSRVLVSSNLESYIRSALESNGGDWYR